MIARVKGFLNRGGERSLKAKKNILYSFFLRGGSVIISFILVPLILNYLGSAKYGIWLTLSSIIAWFSYLDIGLGNGLRNKFSEALARNEKDLARKYVSTTYAGLLLIFGTLFIIFLFVNPLLHWDKILNTPGDLEIELRALVTFVVAFFFLRFILNLIGIIVTADQRPSINSSFGPMGNLLALIIILILLNKTEDSLLYLGIAMSASPVLILLLATIYFFNKDYKDYRPSIKHVNFKYFRGLAGLGLQFFIIQLTVIVIMSTDNMIITQILGPAEVTPYQVAYKYFHMVTIGFTIIITPFWSAVTEAYVKNDIKWIRGILNKIIKVWGVMIGIVIIMLIVANLFYQVWVGDKVKVPFALSAFMGLSVILGTWNNAYAYFINGTGKIRLQLIVSVIMAILNIPISVFFAKYMGMGNWGVILGTCVTIFPMFIISPIQFWKIINKKDVGLWGK